MLGMLGTFLAALLMLAVLYMLLLMQIMSVMLAMFDLPDAVNASDADDALPWQLVDKRPMKSMDVSNSALGFMALFERPTDTRLTIYMGVSPPFEGIPVEIPSVVFKKCLCCCGGVWENLITACAIMLERASGGKRIAVRCRCDCRLRTEGHACGK